MARAGESNAAPTTWAGAGIWYRPAMLGLAVLVGSIGLAISVTQVGAFARRGLLGVDHALFVELGRRWLETGSMYQPWQFSPYRFDQGAGTNDLASMPGLYPPLAGPVFAFVGLFPAFLWWAVPLGVLAFALYRFRPAPWAWPVMAGALLFTSTSSIVAAGGSTMWVTAGVAAGLLYGWPVLVVVLKPTFAPLLLVGVRHRAFWAGVVVLGLVSLTMIPEWLRWFEVLRNTESPGLLYSARDWPFVAVPLVGYLARAR